MADLAGSTDDQAASALSALVGMGILRDESPLYGRPYSMAYRPAFRSSP